MEESTFKLTQIGVVMLGVSEMGRSLAFYRDKLGLGFKGQNEGFAFLDGGAVMLCLSEALGRIGDPIPGATEVVFSVGDVRGAHEALRARGVRFTHEPRTVAGPMWGANFNDPDGHKLSIFGPEGAKPASGVA